MINKNTVNNIIKEVKENYDYNYRCIDSDTLEEILTLFDDNVEYTNWEQYEIIEEYILENIVLY